MGASSSEILFQVHWNVDMLKQLRFGMASKIWLFHVRAHQVKVFKLIDDWLWEARNVRRVMFSVDEKSALQDSRRQEQRLK